MVFTEGEQPVPLHFAQLVRQGAAVRAEIIGKLLAVERDIERIAAVLHGLRGQIGQQPAAQGFRRCVEEFARQGQVFPLSSRPAGASR